MEYKVERYSAGREYLKPLYGKIDIVYIEDMDVYLIVEKPQKEEFKLTSLFSMDDTSKHISYNNYLDYSDIKINCELLLKEQTEKDLLTVEVKFKDSSGVYYSFSPNYHFFNIVVNDELNLTDFYYEPIYDERFNDPIKKIDIRLKNRGLPTVCSDSITDFQKYDKVVYLLESDLPIMSPLQVNKGNEYDLALLTFVNYSIIDDSTGNDNLKVIKSIDPYDSRYYTYSKSWIATRKESRMYRKLARKINELFIEE